MNNVISKNSSDTKTGLMNISRLSYLLRAVRKNSLNVLKFADVIEDTAADHLIVSRCILTNRR
ncbi:hypothetical protein [Psychromonas aquimarina]|uniref:hypothetical protein n=1 Tax=Psychromonas aquimarina TaxID=444919 RepID=UPI00040B9529|nr:hypothetical protein [Psychromonas aquimarina]